MHYKYLRDKPEMTILVWYLMEELQDENLYLEFGWNGFMFLVIYRYG